MNKQLKIITMCSLLLLMVGCSNDIDSELNTLEQIKEKGKIVMATSPDYAPYEFIDPTKSGSDKYVGADIELGTYIANQLGVELELRIMDFSAVLSAISEGKVDIAISGLGYKPERAEAMEFSKTYNMSEDGQTSCHGLLVRKSDVENYKTLSDFFGKNIAAQSASLQESYSENQITDATINTIASLGDGVLRVQNKKSDALATSCTTGEQYAKANEDLVMSTVTFDVLESDGTMVGIPKGEVELLEVINNIIEEVVKEGLYIKWETEYTDYAQSLGLN
ncbi:MAG: transporter substrate-binding domain-containing protein [Turicibacter sp.]